MRDRLLLGALLLTGLIVPFTGCSNPSGLDSISISPTSGALVVGQSGQFTATGTYGNAKHLTTKEITSGVSWSSSVPSVATVDSNGLATAVGAGTTTISASAQGFNGPLTSIATLVVTSSGGGQTGGTVVSLAIVPGSQTVAGPGETAQFLAIGTTSSGATEDLTGLVVWSSSSTQIATIGAGTGLATSVGAGTATITARYANTGGTTVVGTATFTVSVGSTQQYTALSIIPGSESLSASGQTGQFIALATTGTTGVQVDVTSSPQLKWSSTIPSIATVSPTGLATGVSQGSSTITAELTNSDNSVVTGTATVGVTLTTPPEPILSLTIIPSSITVLDFQLTGQFLAIGTFSSPPYVRDLTNDPKTIWLSSEPEIFPVGTNSGGNPGSSAGLVTAFGNGGATIIAESSSSDGTIQTATATFSCPYNLPAPPIPGSCYPGEPIGPTLLETLTVYNEGLNTTNWLVTAPSATGTADVLHCGPGWTGTGGSVCTATYPEGTTITLTAPAGAGAFGGWSYNCVPTAAITAAGPNSCTVTLTSNDSVGAIFN